MSLIQRNSQPIDQSSLAAIAPEAKSSELVKGRPASNTDSKVANFFKSMWQSLKSAFTGSDQPKPVRGTRVAPEPLNTAKNAKALKVLGYEAPAKAQAAQPAKVEAKKTTSAGPKDAKMNPQAEAKFKEGLRGGDLQAIMAHPEGREAVAKCCKRSYTEENLNFLNEVKEFHALCDAAEKNPKNLVLAQDKYQELMKKYVGSDASQEANLTSQEVKDLKAFNPKTASAEALRHVFDKSEKNITKLLTTGFTVDNKQEYLGLRKKFGIDS